MNNFQKKMDTSYENHWHSTALIHDRFKYFRELESISEYFQSLQMAINEVELMQRFLKLERQDFKLPNFVKSTSEIRNGIDYFRRYGINVLKDSDAADLHFSCILSLYKMNAYILTNLYEKFFYFRYFQTNYFLN